MAVVGGKRILRVCMKSGRSDTLKPDKLGLSYKANKSSATGIRDLGARPTDGLWMLKREWHGFLTGRSSQLFKSAKTWPVG